MQIYGVVFLSIFRFILFKILIYLHVGLTISILVSSFASNFNIVEFHFACNNMLVTTELSLPMTGYSNSYKQEPRLSSLHFNKKNSQGFLAELRNILRDASKLFRKVRRSFDNCPTLLNIL